jgi:hypothetical protein
VDIQPFPLVEQIFAGHTYFSLVTASSGQIYWDTEILYANSAFPRDTIAFYDLPKCSRQFFEIDFD